MADQFFFSGVRTDLAIEASSGLPAGAEGLHAEEQQHRDAHVHRIRITSPDTAKQMGKLPGRYVTVTTDVMINRDREAGAGVAKLIAELLTELLPPDRGDSLVVGLGNWNSTPDALGPRVVSKLLVTRHLRGHIPPELENQLRPVAALAPGVLGLTGMETGDIIAAVVERIKPSRVIVVDALAARDLSRLWRTVQITDTGIHPGSGVAGGRKPLDRHTLGVPTIAVGVPTVVPAMMIAESTVDSLAEGGHLGSSLTRAPGPVRQRMLKDVLGEFPEQLLVTPKEVDQQIADAARLLAGAINLALQPEMSADDIDQYLN